MKIPSTSALVIILIFFIGLLAFTLTLKETIPETTTTTLETTTTSTTIQPGVLQAETLPDTTTTSTTTSETTTTLAETTTTEETTTTVSTTSTTLEQSSIIFTEVFYDTPGTDSNEEWFEIYNPTQNSVELTGWKVMDNSNNSWTFPNFILAVSEYATIARDSSGFRSIYACSPHIDTLTRSLANTGGRLILRDSSDQEVDFVAWEGGKDLEYPEWVIEATTNKSIARSTLVDSDSPSDWLSNQDPTPSCV